MANLPTVHAVGIFSCLSMPPGSRMPRDAG
jgi:hypothetical protein